LERIDLASRVFFDSENAMRASDVVRCLSSSRAKRRRTMQLDDISSSMGTRMDANTWTTRTVTPPPSGLCRTPCCFLALPLAPAAAAELNIRPAACKVNGVGVRSSVRGRTLRIRMGGQTGHGAAGNPFLGGHSQQRRTFMAFSRPAAGAGQRDGVLGGWTMGGTGIDDRPYDADSDRWPSVSWALGVPTSPRVTGRTCAGTYRPRDNPLVLTATMARERKKSEPKSTMMRSKTK
jgi:hypothetical protein